MVLIPRTKAYLKTFEAAFGTSLVLNSHVKYKHFIHQDAIFHESYVQYYDYLAFTHI